MDNAWNRPFLIPLIFCSLTNLFAAKSKHGATFNSSICNPKIASGPIICGGPLDGSLPPIFEGIKNTLGLWPLGVRAGAETGLQDVTSRADTITSTQMWMVYEIIWLSLSEKHLHHSGLQTKLNTHPLPMKLRIRWQPLVQNWTFLSWVRLWTCQPKFLWIFIGFLSLFGLHYGRT